MAVIGLFIKVLSQPSYGLLSFLIFCNNGINFSLIRIDQKRDIIFVQCSHLDFQYFKLLRILVFNLAQLMFELLVLSLYFGLDIIDELEPFFM